MKRTVAGLAGLIYGFLLMGLCLAVFSRIDWPHSNLLAKGCHELDKCPASGWILAGLLGYLFGPPILFTLLNVVAWKRWSLPAWRRWHCALTVMAAALYLASYML